MAKDDDLIKRMNEALTTDIENLLKKVLSTQLKPITERLMSVEKVLEVVEKRLNAVEKRLEVLEKRFDVLEKEQKKQGKDLRYLKNILKKLSM